MPYKKYIIKALKITLLIVTFLFIIKFLYDNFNDLIKNHYTLNIPVFIISMLIFWVYKLYNALLWHYITKKNDCSISAEKSVVSWSYSLLGKYLPGKVFLLGGRLYFYHIQNISKLKITLCFFLENIFTLLAASFLFLSSFLFIKINTLLYYKFAAAGLIIMMLIIINPHIVNKFLSVIFKIFKKTPMELTMSYKDMLLATLLFATNWTVQGLGFFMLVNSIYPLSIDNFFYVSGSFALACIIGILSLFAPSGIGVRETIMVLCLKYIIPLSSAIVISAVSRLWSVLGEALFVLIVYIYAKIKGIGYKNDYMRQKE